MSGTNKDNMSAKTYSTDPRIRDIINRYSNEVPDLPLDCIFDCAVEILEDNGDQPTEDNVLEVVACEVAYHDITAWRNDFDFYVYDRHRETARKILGLWRKAEMALDLMT